MSASSTPFFPPRSTKSGISGAISPSRLRCPWFMGGLAFGLLLGSALIGTAISSQLSTTVPSPEARGTTAFPGP